MKRYLRHQTPARRHLRTHGTSAEAALWRHLKERRLEGRRFRRQAGIGPYIVDLYCPSERLVVELDGAVHDTPAAQAYDAGRTRALEAEGLWVLRIENQRVFDDLDGVLDEITAAFAPLGPARTR